MHHDLPAWERARQWRVLRRFVYYLMEDFLPPSWVPGTRLVDFSGGAGDLASYAVGHGAAEVTITVPDEDGRRPSGLSDRVRFLSGVTASNLSDRIPAQSVDLFCARMVFQFPTWEGDRADPDTMLEAISGVLAGGGRVLLAVHEFFPLQRYPSVASESDADRMLDRLDDLAARAGPDELAGTEAQRLAGLVELVRTLGLPPREGPAGETGFGLKVPMLVESLVRAGLEIERAEHVEPFTFPVGFERMLREDPTGTASRADEVLSAKRRAFANPDIDPYTRPARVRDLLDEVAAITPVVWVPIIRLVGRKP